MNSYAFHIFSLEKKHSIDVFFESALEIVAKKFQKQLKKMSISRILSVLNTI